MADQHHSYRIALDYRTSMYVSFELRDHRLSDYSVVLLHEPAGRIGQVAVRVYDFAHGYNEEHPCNQQGERAEGREFHHGTIQEGFNEARRLIRARYMTMIESWLKST